MADIEALFKNKGKFTEDDVRKIISLIGYNYEDLDIDDDKDWDEDIMEGYADYIRKKISQGNIDYDVEAKVDDYMMSLPESDSYAE